jgi:hypothetical protein
MTERGTIVIDRGLFGHSRFADEPFTEREAWAWMIGEAAFRPHCKRVGAVRVELKRGQLCHSIRYMAERWQWSKTRVHRFLTRLAADEGDEPLIGTRSETGMTVVTIRKYDEYQPKPDDSGTPAGTVNGTHAGQQRDKEESIDKGSSSRRRAAPDFGNGPDKPTDADIELAGSFLEAIERKPTDPWLKPLAYQAAVWRSAGRDRAQIIADAAEIATDAKRADVPLSYYVTAIDRRHVLREQARAGPPPGSAAPLQHPGALHVIQKPGTLYQQSRDRFREAVASLELHVAGQSPDGGEGDGCEVIPPVARARCD